MFFIFKRVFSAFSFSDDFLFKHLYAHLLTPETLTVHVKHVLVLYYAGEL